jgi:phosphotransferase system  glucose/maltose/N-acetylglucosamine-specific IIC component
VSSYAIGSTDRQETLLKIFASLFFMLAVCVATGCASSRGGDGERAATTGGSGITVFGTIDAAVSGSRNR